MSENESILDRELKRSKYELNSKLKIDDTCYNGVGVFDFCRQTFTLYLESWSKILLMTFLLVAAFLGINFLSGLSFFSDYQIYHYQNNLANQSTIVAVKFISEFFGIALVYMAALPIIKTIDDGSGIFEAIGYVIIKSIPLIITFIIFIAFLFSVFLYSGLILGYIFGSFAAYPIALFIIPILYAQSSSFYLVAILENKFYLTSIVTSFQYIRGNTLYIIFLFIILSLITMIFLILIFLPFLILIPSHFYMSYQNLIYLVYSFLSIQLFAVGNYVIYKSYKINNDRPLDLSVFARCGLIIMVLPSLVVFLAILLVLISAFSGLINLFIN